jgi:hypothetical protein
VLRGVYNVIRTVYIVTRTPIFPPYEEDASILVDLLGPWDAQLLALLIERPVKVSARTVKVDKHTIKRRLRDICRRLEAHGIECDGLFMVCRSPSGDRTASFNFTDLPTEQREQLKSAGLDFEDYVNRAKVFRLSQPRRIYERDR